MKRPGTGLPFLLCVVLASCGLGDKQAAADGIVASVERVFEAGSARGTMSIDLAFVSAPAAFAAPSGGGGDGADAPPAPPQPSQAQPPTLVTDVALDFANGLAAGSFRGAPKPYAVFDDMDLYARRFNAGEREARPWVHVRGDRLQKGDGGLSTRDTNPMLAAFALNPIVLVDLAAAPLAGSVERLGTETVAGVATTHYKANVDIEKMLRDTRKRQYPEDRREFVDTLLDLLVIRGNTHRGEMWIDDKGMLRRFAVTLRQNPFADLRFDLTLTLELPTIGEPVAVARPGPREVVAVTAVRQFLNAAVPAPGSQEFAEIVIGVPAAALAGLSGLPAGAGAPGA